jgi:hypothetical protein
MEDERPAHSKDSAEKAGLENHIVSWRSLSGCRRRRCRLAHTGPIVLSEHESGEVDFTRKLEEAPQGGCPRIEGRRPGFHMRDVFKTACVSACSSFFCFPDEPRKIRGLSIRLLQPSRSGDQRLPIILRSLVWLSPT